MLQDPHESPLSDIQLPLLGGERNVIQRSALTPEAYATKVFNVARPLALQLQGTEPLTKDQLRTAMTREFGGSDSEGAWNWKDVWEVQEIALVMLLHTAIKPMKAWNPEQKLNFMREKQAMCLTQTVRSEEQQALQQFSTPFTLSYIATHASKIKPSDIVLEPSAGTGMIASFAKVAGAEVYVNEIAQNRTAFLMKIFGAERVSSFNAEQINDYLSTEIRPTLILMNPPFSKSPDMAGIRKEAQYKHVRSALMRLAVGGRLVLISGYNFSPISKTWKEAFIDLQKIGTVVGSFGIAGSAYTKHGTSFDTRMTIFDKVIPDDPKVFQNVQPEKLNGSQLLRAIKSLPPRQEIVTRNETIVVGQSEQRQEIRTAPPEPVSVTLPAKAEPKEPERKTKVKKVDLATYRTEISQEGVIDLRYETIEMPVNQGGEGDGTFEAYTPQRIRIPNAKPHPTTLCESSAMASVMPPIPHYVPRLPRNIIEDGVLSTAQLETVIYAGQAHSSYLRGHYLVKNELDEIEPTSADNASAIRFRRGYFLGDGTGAGKGRQVAGVVMDNFLHGRDKAIWISKNGTLIEDARRDWEALGGRKEDIRSLDEWKLGTDVTVNNGIIFTTYSTLRSEKGGKSRLAQLTKWAGADFEGALVFDESHGMGNAITQDNGARGSKAPSQQGVKGLRLQNALPSARIMYVSATGATEVANLAYAGRLGLWQTGEFPFSTRSEFLGAIESGGIAAMEVVCRDLKTLGLYQSRSLSFDGVEYSPLRIEVNQEQTRVYGVFAEAFKLIHHNIEAALKATNVVSSSGKTQNRNAKAAASSVFEGMKQRFFNYILTASKIPTLIRAIEEDLANDKSVVIQITSTNQALISRRLNDIPPDEWNNLNIDITPREGVIHYLNESFPIHLYREFQDEHGNIYAEMVKDEEGNPVVSQEALEIKNSLIERISLLPALSGALEQLLHHFGHANVAEVTGRSERILKDPDADRLYVAKRVASANSDETISFMSGEKRIIIFSDAGGTGRSYHSSLDCQNQQQRVHYLLEAGWRADSAIQGLGRSHRTHQAHPPIFRTVTTDILGEKRFEATISRRIASLGALTRGQRQAGGQNIFDDRDNLESRYAQQALHIFLRNLASKQVEGITLAEFEEATGLKLTTKEGLMVDELPPMQRFLNRLMALPIPQQNLLFTQFDVLHQGLIEAAISSGTYETGVETIKGENLTLKDRKILMEHPTSGSTTICSEIEMSVRNILITSEKALKLVQDQYPRGWEQRLVVNSKSQNAAVVLPTSSVADENGRIYERVRLLRPYSDETKMMVAEYQRSNWVPIRQDLWQGTWDQQYQEAPKYSTSRIFIVSGLLLPVWEAMLRTDPKVYRVDLDNGERLIGRKVTAQQIDAVAKAIGFSMDVAKTPEEIFNAVLHDDQNVTLGGGFTLRRSFIQNARRIEVTGNIGNVIDRLKATGCFTEMIQWKTRAFVPTDEHRGVYVIGQLLEMFK
jgi:predicted RNA methylase